MRIEVRIIRDNGQVITKTSHQVINVPDILPWRSELDLSIITDDAHWKVYGYDLHLVGVRNKQIDTDKDGL